MSGIPIPTTGSWASEGVYPGAAGSSNWAAQSMTVRPYVDYFTPNTQVPAETLNWLFKNSGADFKQLTSLVCSVAANNFYAAHVPNTFWVSATNDGPRWVFIDGYALYDSIDGGQTLFLIQTFTGPPLAVIGGGGLLLLVQSTQATWYSGRTSVSAALGFTATLAGGVADRVSGDVLLYLVNQTGSTFTGALWAISETTSRFPTAQSLPASWSSATGVQYQIFGASSPTCSLLARTLNSTGAPNNSALLQCTQSAGDAFTCTDITPASFYGHQIEGIGYDDLTSTWAVLTYDGTNSYFFTTPDLVTWTRTLPAGFANLRCTGLASVGGVWLTMIPSTYAPTSTRHPCMSMDGGATWHLGCLSTGASTPCTVVSSSNQFCVFWGAGMATSYRVGPA